MLDLNSGKESCDLQMYTNRKPQTDHNVISGNGRKKKLGVNHIRRDGMRGRIGQMGERYDRMDGIYHRINLREIEQREEGRLGN